MSLFARIGPLPGTSAVVIYDREGSDILEKTLLQDIAHEILPVRGERYYLSLAIIMGILRRLGLLFEQKNLPRGRKLRFLAGQLFRIFQLSCLAVMRPKVVLTYIDNSYDFQWLSRRYQGAMFYAIQNGVRSPYDVADWLPPNPHPARVISMPHFFCYGEYERDLYAQYGHQVDNFHPVGSLQAGYYKANLPKKNPARVFDLCLVSQWWEEVESPGGPVAEIKRSVVTLHEMLRRYLSETRVSMCVAMRSADGRETGYFRRLFGDHVRMIPNNRDAMSTYFAMDEGGVVLTHDSSAAREAFGWGKKVLFCNFSGHANYDSPRPGPWSVTDADYPLFKDKLDRLRSMEPADFSAAAGDHARYLMKYNPQCPAHKVIRGKILEALGGAGAGDTTGRP